VFGQLPLCEVTAEAIEDYIHTRLHSKRKVHTKLGVQFRDTIKPVTVHQEYRVLRRLLNVAVKKKVLGVTPCDSVEFPMLLLSATRKPHYMTSNEQRKIEFFAPDYLRRIVTIISEMGLRPQRNSSRCSKPRLISRMASFIFPTRKRRAVWRTCP
jgi:hypothetical protein